MAGSTFRMTRCSSAHETPAEDFFALFRAYRGATVALNIKELGSEDALIELLDHEDVAWGNTSGVSSLRLVPGVGVDRGALRC